MVLNLEWQHRLAPWREELPRHLYRPLGTVSMEGFVTTSQLTPDEALAETFSPMPVGTRWGKMWEYGWFKGELTLPTEAEGARIVLLPEVGGEGIVWVNGEAAGARDRGHAEITLTRSGAPGTRYEVLIESYAGHGPRLVHGGPTPPDREMPLPESDSIAQTRRVGPPWGAWFRRMGWGGPDATQETVGETTYGVWQEDVYQLWLDVETLFQTREHLDENSLRLQEIDAGLRDFTLIVDFELPNDEMLETVRACRERLAPLMACVNGSTAPEMFAFGHAHLDVAWLWPLQETERKMGRTLATQLALMAEYPEFKFLQSQPHLYRMLEQRYPDIYARIKEAAAKGQFVPEGATWVEPDTNMTGGESMIRQFIHGKRFFRQEFGVDCDLLWLPDVFGYSGAMPQIMRGCDVKYFSTQKIFWAYHGGDPFPYNTFIWEGIDGSEVYVHLHNDYSARVDAASVIQRWNERVQKDGFSTRLYPFGYGDGGGGPTRDHLEAARRLKNFEGVPKVRMAAPKAYFEDQEAKGWPKDRYVGELYFQCHRGVFTSQAKIKWGNRKSEFALRRAELWGVAARILAGFDFTAATLDAAWKGVLLNQFHDILPGSSIARVYDEAEVLYDQVIEEADCVTADAATALAKGDDGMTVFNDLSWERTGLVPLPDDYAGAQDEAGAPVPVQAVGDDLMAEVTVPSFGWTTLHPAEAAVPSNQLKATPDLLENELLRVEFNDRGEIVSLVDKTVPLGELATGACNSFQMFKDVPSRFDAWDIDSMYEETPVALDQPAEIEVISAGPLVATLKVTRALHTSTMTQEISLRRDSRRLDFKTTIDWHERHKLLKVAFPVRIHSDEALHEIQFGYIKRPNHRSRPFDADRFEVPNQKWTALVEENRGCAVLNDCKYGVNVVGDTIKLTLLKSAIAPDYHADQGMQEFTYAFYAWNGTFAESDVVREGYDLNAPLMTAPGDAGTASLFSVDAPNVVIETVKPAEESDTDVVVRIYESKRMAVQATLSTTLPVTGAALTNMLEETVVDDLPVAKSTDRCEITVSLRPFEVKTLKLNIG